jgi:hypothetical protein
MHTKVAGRQQPALGTLRQRGALHHATGQLPHREDFFLQGTLPRFAGSAGRKRACTTAHAPPGHLVLVCCDRMSRDRPALTELTITGTVSTHVPWPPSAAVRWLRRAIHV